MMKCYILVGLPGSGKSTWVRTAPVDWNNTVVASTDDFIDKEATRQNKTYSEVFKGAMPSAINAMTLIVKNAIKNKQDIILDQTSLTKMSRVKKLWMLPPEYEVIAVVFKTPEMRELHRRLASRPGKVIPPDVLGKMMASYEEPSESEGFDQIVYVA